MKSRSDLFLLLVIAAALVLTACGGAAAPTIIQAPATQAPAATEAPAMEAPLAANDQFAQAGAPVEKSASVGQALDANAPAPAATASAYEITNSSGELTVI